MKKVLALLVVIAGLSFNILAADDSCCTPPIPPCPPINCPPCVDPCYVAGLIAPGTNIGSLYTVSVVGQDNPLDPNTAIFYSIQFNRPFCGPVVAVAWGTSSPIQVRVATSTHIIIRALESDTFYFIAMSAS